MKTLSVILWIHVTALLCLGCGIKRPSVIAGPPVDLLSTVNDEELEALLTTADLQLGGQADYYLGPGDVISIQLLGRDDVLGVGGDDGGLQFTLTDAPFLSLPLIGAIKVHNKTAGQLQDDLKAAYATYVRDPQPLVLIREFSQNRVSVLGSVSNPGSYPLIFGDTAIDLIFEAGGLATSRSGGGAPGRYLKIYRERLTGAEKAELSLEELIEAISEEGRVLPREEIVIPIEDLVHNGILSYNVPLRQNDILYIPFAGTINMHGYIQSPGITFLGPSLRTISQAVTERGGLKMAAASGIEIVRTYSDGQNVSYFLDVRETLGRRAPDFIIRDGDEVIVYSTWYGELGEWIDRVFTSSVRAGANYTYSPSGGP